MAIKLNLAQGASAPLAERVDRQDAGARQDRWMLELERAAFSTRAKKLRGAQLPGGPTAAQQASPQPADAGSASPPAGRQGASAASGSATAARTGADAAKPGLHVQNVDFSSTARGMAAARVLNTVTALVPAGMPAASAAPAAPSGQACAADPVLYPPTSRPASASPTLFGRLVGLPPDGSEQVQAGPDMAEPSASGVDTPADAAQFDKRLLHLFAGPEGTHAYIRDAELGAAQVRRVADVLGTALAAGGRVLTALTVNGKPISMATTFTPGAAFDIDGTSMAADDAPAAPPSYLQSLALARKELSE